MKIIFGVLLIFLLMNLNYLLAKINSIKSMGLLMVWDQYLQTSLILMEGSWSLGKYRNINLANSLFDFTFKDNSYYVNSSLYPIDGGVIEVEYNSDKNNLINLDFKDISTSWTILTAVDIFNFDNKKVIPTSKFNILNDLEINKDNNSFEERLDFITKFIEKNKNLEEKFKLKKYLGKFKSRYNGKITINGDKVKNYKLNANLNGYLDVSNGE